MAKNTPQYQAIKEDIRGKIMSGFYKPDELIPTEQELSAMYHVSRVTIRKATDILVYEGLLERRAGYGTIVKPNAFATKSLQHMGFHQEMEKQHRKVTTKLCEFTLMPADHHIASLLQIAENDMVYYFERLRFGNDEALQYEATYMSIKKFPDLTARDLENSKYAYVESKGTPIDFCVHDVIPILPDKKIRDIFQLPVNTPILMVLNTTYLTDGTIMDYTKQYMNTEKLSVRYLRNYRQR
jgi:GntR family glv operon transcriptional regulator/GntR family mannosyl-D-glycerate transport/metabolism transcriptional repressor